MAYAHISNDGNASVSREFVFNGVTYSAGASINTNIDFSYSRLGWTWEFINIGNNTFKFGTLLDAKWFTLEPKADGAFQTGDQITQLSSSKKFNLVLPTMGLPVDYNPVKYLNLFAEGSGMPAGKHGYLFDSEAGIKIIPPKWFGIVGSYRYFGLKAKDGDQFAKLTYNGPYVGVTVRY